MASPPEFRLGVSADEASALFQIDSTTRGALIPRMTTTQRDAIVSPAASLLIYNTTLSAYQSYIGGAWVSMISSASPADFTDNLTITKADPSIILNTLTATDTDFWIGVQEDAGGDNDDTLQIGTGTTPGTGAFLTLTAGGALTTTSIQNTPIGSTTPSTGAFTTLSATGALTLSGAPGLIKPAADSSNALGFANAAGTQFYYVNTSTETVSIGITPASDSKFKVFPTSVVTSGSVFGINAAITANPGSASSGAYCGFQAVAFSQSANGNNITGSLRGANVGAIHQGTATLTTGIGVRVQNQNTSTGTVSAMYGLRVESTANSGGGAITVNYGVRVESQTVGGTNYAIHTENGLIVFNESGADADFRVEGDTDANLFFTDASADMVGFKTNAPTAVVDINSDKFRLRTAKTPSSASDTGNTGDICWDSGFLYVATGTNTWKRVAIATW